MVGALHAKSPEKSIPIVEIKDHRFQVEIVRTPEEWEKGLMFRKTLAPNEGMLFWGTEERLQSFWMKNTYVPLDILFLKADGEIVHIAENTVPLSETPIPSIYKATHILEILGGRSKAIGIQARDTQKKRPGDRVKFLFNKK